MRSRHAVALGVALACVAGGTGAAPPSSPAAQASHSTAAVEAPGGEWGRAEPGERGLDPRAVAAAVEGISKLPGVESLLVVAGGDVVVDRGFGGGTNDQPHNLKSASKSLLSALVGIALEEGVLPGLDAPLSELLREELPDGADAAAKGRITLRHLLTQTTGLESTSGPGYGPWVATENWTRAALVRPMLSPPGAEFRYSTGNTHLVSAVLTAATGESTLEYARSRLLDPLGIGEVSWERSPEGVYLGGNQLSMTPKDLARFGLLYLNDGKWNGRQLVPAPWVAESTEKHVETGPDWQDRYGDYGYLWWVPGGHHGAYLAVGYGGQYLYVAPQADLIVVMTATLEGKGAEWDRRALELIRGLSRRPTSN